MLWITNWNTTMDLANLNAFIAIAETGSFSGTGERLHLTQPAISKRIAGLEQQLKVRLFDRLGREVGLTEAGRALLPRAYQILNVLDDTRRALTNLTGEVSGRLTLATSHHIGLHRLPPILRTFTRQYPNVALDIQFLDSEVAYEEILHGRAEVAVITLAPEHSLTSNGSVNLADIAGHPAVFPGGNTFTHHIVRRLFEAQGLTPNIAMSTNYLETIKMMVSIGLAWSVLPRTMLDDQVASIALPGIQLSRQLGYIVHTERTLSNAARAFMSLLDAQVDLPGTPA